MLEKTEKILFYIFLFLIPFQIRIFLSNAGNEWNSIFVYFGDGIFFLVFLLFLNRIKRKRVRISKKNLLLLILVLVAFVSILISSATKISAFRWVKLIEFIILYIYICKSAAILGINRILSIIFYSGALQAILAIVQFIKQGSINIKFIEAGIFSPNSPGVANFVLNGERIMRSYGSFTHPNVLAGFMLLAIFCLYKKLLIENPKLKTQNSLLVICYLLLVFGLFLTFSRTAIAVFGIMTAIFFLIEFFKLRKLELTEQRLADGKKLIKLFCWVFISCVLVIVILFPHLKARFFTISMEEQAVDLRFFYNRMALQMIKEKPILGIGIGNFVHYSQNYPAYLRAATRMLNVSEGNQGEIKEIPQWLYQPVHNIYLLIASEIGILGMLVFLGFVGIVLFKGIRSSCFLLLVFCFLLIGFADHYFWTLQQGGIMFWLALALTKKSD